MKKSNLLRFLSKYLLGKQCNAVTWNSNSNLISAKFITEDRSCIGSVNTPLLELDSGDYHIYETTTLAAMLGVLGEDMKVKVVRDVDVISALNITDGATKLVYATAVPEVIPKIPKLIDTSPNIILEFNISTEFMEKFSKARSALENVKTFALINSDDGARVVLGHSENENVNSIQLSITPTVDAGLDEPVFFHAQHVKEAFAANKDVPEGKFILLDNGILQLSFISDEFNTQYNFIRTQEE